MKLFAYIDLCTNVHRRAARRIRQPVIASMVAERVIGKMLARHPERYQR